MRASESLHGWRVFGIPIHVDPSWAIVFICMTWSLATRYFPFSLLGAPAWLYWLMGASAVALLFVCVLLHELGHAFMAQRHGIGVAGLRLFLFGGVAQLAGQPRRPRTELLIAAVGLLISALIAGACALAGSRLAATTPWEQILSVLLEYLSMINLALALFNLLPGFPLDGGRLVRAALWAWSGDLRRATRIASALGIALGYGLMALGLWGLGHRVWFGGGWYILLGWYLRNSARATYRRT